MIIIKNSVTVFILIFWACLEKHAYYLWVTLSDLNESIDSDRTYQYK